MNTHGHYLGPRMLLTFVLVSFIATRWAVVEGCFPRTRRRDPRRMTSEELVRTEKNLLVRERISLLDRDLGVKAKLGDPCDQVLFDRMLAKVYTSSNERGPENNLTVYERSDLLYLAIRVVEAEMKKNANSRMRRDLCMSTHLMICKNSKCECPSGSEYKEYNMGPTVDGPGGECRVNQGGKCNPESLLLCHANLLCFPYMVKNANSFTRPFRCTCVPFDPNEKWALFDTDNSKYAAPPLETQLKYNVKITPLPSLNLCHKGTKYRSRPRSYQ